MLNVPVAVSSYIQKAGETSTKLLSETVTEFAAIPNGDIRPSRTLEQRFSSPVSAPYSTYAGPANPLNPSYIETQVFTYNNASELAGIKDEGNRTILNIYDYNSKYVIGSVINANALTDKSAYTSFETSIFGGWILNGSAIYNTSVSVTGGSSFVLSGSNTLTSSLTVAKSHMVSFWSTTGNITVSGGQLTKTGPTINGFTYYEYTIPQGGGNVVIGGNGIIDELRSYPATGRMRTVSYDPIIGKTSECDENNRISYYEYDDLGRLKFIKDEFRNIIKMYEYNVISYKPGGCTQSFSNKAITEVFIKNDCGNGYIGGEVFYSIPAGRYTSTVSQAAADVQAQMELNLLGQNYANTNGTCIQVYGNDQQSQNFVKRIAALELLDQLCLIQFLLIRIIQLLIKLTLIIWHCRK